MDQKEYLDKSCADRKQYDAQQFNLTIPVSKSSIQIELERRGYGQEKLSNHEIDEKKQCYCGRPLK